MSFLSYHYPTTASLRAFLEVRRIDSAEREPKIVHSTTICLNPDDPAGIRHYQSIWYYNDGTMETYDDKHGWIRKEISHEVEAYTD